MNLFSLDCDAVPNVRLIGFIAYTKPWIHFTRLIDEYILYAVKSGELYIKEGNEEYILKKGDIILLEPNIVHTGFREACCSYYYVHFKHPGILKVEDKSYDEISKEIISNRKLSLTSDLFSDRTPTDSICYIPKFYHYENEPELMSFFKDANDDFHQKYENYKKVASLKLLELLIRIYREYTSTKIDNIQTHFSKAFIKSRSIADYLNKEYRGKITSKEIENLFESNYDYLNRIFQKMTGYTIFNYLNILRVNKAKELIDTTFIKFSEIGYLVGVEDPYYFSKLFKKYTGMTPSQYSKNKSGL